MQTHPYVRDSITLPQPTADAVEPLRGAPTFTPRELDLEKNFLEVDPDNPTRLLEYFSGLLKHGTLEPSQAQKDLMKEMQALLDAIEAESIRRPDDFDTDPAAIPAEREEAPTSCHSQVQTLNSPRLCILLCGIDQGCIEV